MGRTVTFFGFILLPNIFAYILEYIHKPIISTCCISGVYKDHALVSRPNHLQHLLVAHLVHVLTLSHRVHLLYPDKGGSQRHGPKPAVKEEEAHVWINAQELCHVKVVRQGG